MRRAGHRSGHEFRREDETLVTDLQRNTNPAWTKLRSNGDRMAFRTALVNRFVDSPIDDMTHTQADGNADHGCHESPDTLHVPRRRLSLDQVHTGRNPNADRSSDSNAISDWIDDVDPVDRLLRECLVLRMVDVSEKLDRPHEWHRQQEWPECLPPSCPHGGRKHDVILRDGND